MQEELDAAEIASRAVDRVKWKGRLAELELTNGIVLSLKPVPPFMLTALSREFQPPDPPKVYIEEKGREEENPNDPGYIRLLEKLEAEQTLALNDLVLAIGTSVKSLPEGYFGPDEDGWIAQVEYAFKSSGRDFKIERDDEIKRYIHWLRFYALETNIDIALATGLYAQLIGVREGEIEEVVNSFRSVPRRGADSESAAPSGSENGNSANRATRRSRARS